jgi:cysteinyl-tRNA synthetase
MAVTVYSTSARGRMGLPEPPAQVGMYVCGPTVYRRAHIGNARPFVVFSWLRNWLRERGYAVTLVQNITDINDRIYEAAPGRSAELAVQATAWYLEDTDDLGLGRPDFEPKATETVDGQIAFIEDLISRNLAYSVDGDVYYRVGAFAEYGRLSGQRPDQVEEQEPNPLKQDPRDFALWKAHKPDEPATASWHTPYGRGRPGWHLECSAMAAKYLGDEFDIHGGGLDLRFPHHENELAQSKAAGRRFARLWMHNAMVNLSGAKMSKSVGNTLLVSEVVKRVRPVELRYYLLAAHYRSVIEFSEESLSSDAAAYRRLEGYVLRADEAAPGVEPSSVPAAFAEAMDDDLAVPQALAVLFEAVHEGNGLLAGGESAALRENLGVVRAMLGVLGLDPLAEPWSGGGRESGTGGRLRDVVGSLVQALIEQRQEARARKDFATADAIRDRLKAAGIAVEDTPAGPRWELADDGR